MVVATALAAAALEGQVGHDPSSSPYAEARAGQMIAVSGGYLAGSRGRAGVGPAGGFTVGSRFEIAFADPGIAFLGASGAILDRVVIDPTFGPASRVQDTVTQSVLMLEGGLLLVLTGRKTWRGLAPYVGASVGLALGGRVPRDSSGFVFSTKFQVGPHLGVRWHVSDRVNWRIEARNVLWRLTYPVSFRATPENEPTEPAVLEGTTSLTEWTHHPSLVFAVAYVIQP
ncbi:MAG: hypothetical protein ACE5PT_02060 [Gemmatimonadales bacterium]